MRGMKEYIKEAKAEENKLEELLGVDWNTTRARSYISAVISSHRRTILELQKELDYERTLHQRVEAALAKARIEKE